MADSLTELLGSVERASQLIREKIESRLTSGPDGLRRAFQFFDKDGSGSISLPEFDKALKEYIMLDLDEPTVRGCFERFDDDRAMTGAQQRKKPHPSKPRNTASSKPAAPASSNKRGSGRLVTPKRSAGIQATCYFMFTFGLFGVLAGAIGDVWGARAFANVAGLTFEQAIPIAVAFGPIAFGVFLLKVFGDTYS